MKGVGHSDELQLSPESAAHLSFKELYSDLPLNCFDCPANSFTTWFTLTILIVLFSATTVSCLALKNTARYQLNTTPNEW